MPKTALVPIHSNNSVDIYLEIEETHLWAFSLFRWHGKAPFIDGVRAHLLYSAEEREKRFRDTGKTTKAYSFSAARLSWMLEHSPERLKEIISNWQETGRSFKLAQELQRPFRILYRTSNKLNVTMMNIKCPAVAEISE